MACGGGGTGFPASLCRLARPPVRSSSLCAVNLAAAVQRGQLDMLCMRRYTWAQFPGTAHLVLGLYTPQDQPGSRQGSSYRGDRGDGSSGSSSSTEPKVSWKIWLVACEPLQQQEQQQQQPEDACASSSSDEGGEGPATGKSSNSGSTELRYLTCIMRQEGRGAFSWELVGSGAVDPRRGGRQEARRPAPLQVRLFHRSCMVMPCGALFHPSCRGALFHPSTCRGARPQWVAISCPPRPALCMRGTHADGACLPCPTCTGGGAMGRGPD